MTSSLGHWGLKSPGSRGPGHKSPSFRLCGADSHPGLPWDQALWKVSLYYFSHAWQPSRKGPSASFCT